MITYETRDSNYLNTLIFHYNILHAIPSWEVEGNNIGSFFPGSHSRAGIRCQSIYLLLVLGRMLLKGEMWPEHEEILKE